MSIFDPAIFDSAIFDAANRGIVTTVLDDISIVATGRVGGHHGVVNTTLDDCTCTSSIGWPIRVALRPTVDDDQWGGTLVYVWTQELGPHVALIVSPSTLWTDVLIPDSDDVYVFKITVTRLDDGLVSSAYARVRVIGTPVPIIPPDPETVNLSINNTNVPATINSMSISEGIGQPSTCSFKVFHTDIAIDIGDLVILERSGIRLFGGICLSYNVVDTEQEIFYSINVIGFAWHLSRTLVTKFYKNYPIAAIVSDLINEFALGGITIGYIQGDLPNITITFSDTPLDAALSDLTKYVKGLHWRVDAFRRLHFAITETNRDPQALTPYHGTLRDLSVTKSLGQLANRVKVYYTEPSPDTSTSECTHGAIVGTVEVGATEIQVASLCGWSPSGGTFQLNGSTVTYRATETRRVRSVYEQVRYSYMTAVAGSDSGDLGAPIDSPPPTFNGGSSGQATGTFGVYPISYQISLLTPDGETPPIAYFNGPSYGLGLQLYPDMGLLHHQAADNVPDFEHGSWDPAMYTITVNRGAVEVTVLGIIFEEANYPQSPELDPKAAAWSRITGINIYRTSPSELSAPGDLPAPGPTFLVGSLPPKGGVFIDKVSKSKLAPVVEPPWRDRTSPAIQPSPFRTDGSYVWDPPSTYWLTIVTGVGSKVEATPENPMAVQQGTFVTVYGNQAELSRKFGDSGVVETVLQAGTMTKDKAMVLGYDYLNQSIAVSTSISCSIEDPNAVPGQTLDMSLPAPYGEASLKIQQVSITGFEQGIPHRTTVTAAVQLVTLDDLLKR